MRHTVPHLDGDSGDSVGDGGDRSDCDINGDDDNKEYYNEDVDPLTIMSNLFSSSLTPSTMVIVCPIFTIPLTSLA